MSIFTDWPAAADIRAFAVGATATPPMIPSAIASRPGRGCPGALPLLGRGLSDNMAMLITLAVIIIMAVVMKRP